MKPSSPLPDGARVVVEPVREHPPSRVHPEWVEALPWLVQGTTTRGRTDEPFDLGLFSEGSPQDEVRHRWQAVLEATGMRSAIHARQPHESVVRVHSGERSHTIDEPPTLVDPCDGHLTSEPGVLVAVTTADCVPVFLVDPAKRAVAAVHAGWRGAAAGVLERALEAMTRGFGTDRAGLRVHLGPAICGSCYEVGPEVFDALDRPVPPGPEPIDLRAILVGRAVEAGVVPGSVTVSSACTLCGDGSHFSHRGGDAQRQIGYVGVLP